MSRKVEATRKLVEVVETKYPMLVQTRDFQQEIPWASLARAARLTRGVLLLHDGALDDVTPLPVRPIFENVLVGLYALYGGEDAVVHILGSFLGEAKKLPYPNVKADVEEILGPWGNRRRDRLNWEQLFPAVQELLTEQGPGRGGAALTSMYDEYYRGASQLHVHGGYTSVRCHVSDTDDGRRQIKAIRDDADDSAGDVQAAGVLLALFASHVFESRGMDTTEVDSLAQAMAFPVDE